MSSHTDFVRAQVDRGSVHLSLFYIVIPLRNCGTGSKSRRILHTGEVGIHCSPALKPARLTSDLSSFDGSETIVYFQSYLTFCLNKQLYQENGSMHKYMVGLMMSFLDMMTNRTAYEISWVTRFGHETIHHLLQTFSKNEINVPIAYIF